MKHRSPVTVNPLSLSSTATVAVKTASRPIEVFSIEENLLIPDSLKTYNRGLGLIRDESSTKRLEPRDSRYWLNPARCFSAPAAYNYRASDDTQISLNTGIEDLVIDVLNTPRTGKASFVIRVARVLARKTTDIYDTLIITVNTAGEVKVVYSYPPSELLGSRSRVVGLDVGRADLHVVLPPEVISVQPRASVAGREHEHRTYVHVEDSGAPVDAPEPLRAKYRPTRKSFLTVSPPEAVEVDLSSIETLTSPEEVDRIINLFDYATVQNLIKGNHYIGIKDGKLCYCKPCSRLASKIGYSSTPIVDNKKSSEDFESALVVFLNACKKVSATSERKQIVVDPTSLEYLFEHKFLSVFRSLTEKETTRLEDAIFEIFSEHEITSGASTELLYIPPGTLTKEGIAIGKSYLLHYAATVSKGKTDHDQILEPNLLVYNSILAAAGKATYKTLAELEESLPTDITTEADSGKGDYTAGAGSPVARAGAGAGSPVAGAGDDVDSSFTSNPGLTWAKRVRGNEKTYEVGATAGGVGLPKDYTLISAAGFIPSRSLP